MIVAEGPRVDTKRRGPARVVEGMASEAEAVRSAAGKINRILSPDTCLRNRKTVLRDLRGMRGGGPASEGRQASQGFHGCPRQRWENGSDGHLAIPPAVSIATRCRRLDEGGSGGHERSTMGRGIAHVDFLDLGKESKICKHRSSSQILCDATPDEYLMVWAKL